MSPHANWSCEEDEVLINFIRNREPMYNVKSKDYRNTQLKYKWWREIGEILNKTDYDCTKRWSYIRDYYIRRRGKPSGEAAKKRASQLSFLDNVNSSQRNNENNDDYEDEDQIDNNEIAEDTVNNSGNMEYDDIKIEYCHNDEETLSENSYAQEIETVMIIDNKTDRKRKNNEHTQELASRVSAHSELDENDLFFGSMAKIMKKLPQLEQVQLRMQIGTLIGTAELRHISNK